MGIRKYLPRLKHLKTVTVEVEENLHQQVKMKAKREGYKIREIVEAAFKEYLNK